MPRGHQFDWFVKLDQDQQNLIKLSEFLLEREQMSQAILTDYAFVVFPVAKAYEAFLKQYLYDLQLIPQHTYESNKFRIGRALNPDIRESQQDEFWLYDNVEQLCGGGVARELWQTWLNCRNKVVHFFPLETHRVSLTQAEDKLNQILITMDMAFHCRLELQNK